MEAISLVCKVKEANGRPAVKLSDNLAKPAGDKREIQRYIRFFGSGILFNKAVRVWIHAEGRRESTMLRREGVLAYVRERYQTLPERPWSRFPHYIVLRHKAHARWFGVLMNIPRAELGLTGAGNADIIDLKAGADLTELLSGNGGILPAYHMDKEHWLSALLDGSVPDSDLCALIDKSYTLTV